MFAFRYFEVAEMFGRADKSNERHTKIRKITSKICYLGIAIIILTYSLNIGDFILDRINPEPNLRNATL